MFFLVNSKSVILAAKHPYFAALSAVKTAILVGVTGIEPAPSWSQTKRLTIRQHPDKIFNFSQLWSNLWSSHCFLRRSITIFSRFRRFSPDCSLFRKPPPKSTARSQTHSISLASAIHRASLYDHYFIVYHIRICFVKMKTVVFYLYRCGVFYVILFAFI